MPAHRVLRANDDVRSDARRQYQAGECEPLVSPDTFDRLAIPLGIYSSKKSDCKYHGGDTEQDDRNGF